MKHDCLADIFLEQFFFLRNFNLAPSEEIRRIINDIYVEANFSGELSDITISISMLTTK